MLFRTPDEPDDARPEKGPDVSKGRKSSIYVLTGYEGTRTTVQPTRNALYVYASEHRDELSPGFREFLDAYDRKDDESHADIRRWAEEFIHALRQDGTVLSTKFRPVDINGDWSTMVLAMYHLALSGPRGVTAHEVKVKADVISDGISGSLSKLHAAGIAVRLEERR